jgi:preprotein translocase SecE subunit
VAEKLEDITVSDEEEFELEAETASVQAPEAPGGVPPKKTTRGTLPPGGGGRGGKQREATPGFFTRLGQFIRDTRAEMRRVSWPSANEVKNTTIITLIAVVFFALYLFGVDRVWAYLIDHLRTWLGG